jgi:hypothetical protein
VGAAGVRGRRLDESEEDAAQDVELSRAAGTQRRRCEGQDELLRTAKRLDPELRTVIVGDTAYWRETLADVYLPKGLPKAEMELRERLKILASRKRGPKKPAASVPLVDVDVRRRA